MDLIEAGEREGTEFNWNGKEISEGPSLIGDKLSGFIKGRKFLDYLIECLLTDRMESFKRSCSSWVPFSCKC